jgi:hypothetical protein
MKPGFLIAVTALASVAGAQLSEREQGGINDALRIANVRREETSSERGTGGLPVSDFLRTLLNSPLSAIDQVASLHGNARLPLSESLIGATTKLYGPLPAPDGFEVKLVLPSSVPLILQPSISNLVKATALANARIRTILSPLNADERRALIEGLPQWAAGDARVPFSFVKRPVTDARPLLPLLAKIDLNQLRASGLAYVAEISNATKQLQQDAKGVDLATPLRLKLLGVTVEISGRANDRHASSDAMLCVDLGGDDVYSGRYGAGIGYASAVIDLGGNDRYEGGDANFGTGILGFGLCLDLAGRDTYDAGSATFGVGLAGVGVLWDSGGDDRYHGVALTQGFGAYGIGLLRDDAGRDTYDAGLRGQGSGRTQGLGWLVDGAGDDIYRLGGALGAKPSAVSKARGYGQGYGGGFDPELDQPGGVGLLSDLAGDDAYLGGVAVQASASDGSLGSLQDESGDDTYRSRAKGEGFATNSSVAVLMDQSGDDSYTVLSGPGLGFASGKSLSALIESDGDDLYAARDARPGIAVDESFSLFLDGGGSDRYPGTPAVAMDRADLDSISLFADLGGLDTYPEGLADSTARANPTRWAAVDEPTETVADAGTEGWPETGSSPDPGEHQISELYRQALSSGDARVLVGIGTPALDFAIKRHLDDALTRKRWLLASLCSAMPSAAVERLNSATLTSAALRLIGDAHLIGARELVLKGLLSEDTATEAAFASGRLKMPEATRLIIPLAAPGDRRRVLIALKALAEIGSIDGFPAAQPYLNSTDSALRAAAQRVVALDPARALEVARVGLLSSEPRSLRFTIELLGAIGTPGALQLLEPSLKGGSSDTKLAALLAYRGRIPARLASVLDQLRNDVDPLVRIVASGLDWEP